MSVSSQTIQSIFDIFVINILPNLPNPACINCIATVLFSGEKRADEFYNTILYSSYTHPILKMVAQKTSIGGV